MIFPSGNQFPEEAAADVSMGPPILGGAHCFRAPHLQLSLHILQLPGILPGEPRMEYFGFCIRVQMPLGERDDVCVWEQSGALHPRRIRFVQRAEGRVGS